MKSTFAKGVWRPFLSTFVAGIALLFVASCATMETPTTPAESIYAGVEEARALYNTADRLHTSGVISDAEFRDVLDNLEDANDALNRARTLYDLGRDLEADERLAFASEVLIAVRGYLESKNE